MVLFAQFRDVWFTVVAQHAVRELANRTFRHLHELSLRFHLERRTGGLEPRHRARRQRRRHHRAHGGAQLDPDRGRAAHDLGPCRLVFRLDLRGGRAGSRSASMSAFTFWASERRIAIRRDMNESDTEAPLEGGRQPAQLRDGQIFRQRGARGAPLRFLHGALREGGDPDLHLARRAQHRPGGDLHHRHRHLHAARGARRRRRHAHHRRLRDDQRHPHAALSCRSISWAWSIARSSRA